MKQSVNHTTQGFDSNIRHKRFEDEYKDHFRLKNRKFKTCLTKIPDLEKLNFPQDILLA